MRLVRIIMPALVLSCIFVVNSRPGLSQSTGALNDKSTTAVANEDANRPADAIPPGTVITIDNWRSYRQFMPDGMVALFEGKYFWKMPSDVRMEVGPTVIHPLPKNYVEATEKYSSQIKLIEMPGGGLKLAGYRGGIPFPSLAEPHKGWKVLANLWYRYMPHLLVDTNGYGCAINGNGNIN